MTVSNSSVIPGFERYHHRSNRLNPFSKPYYGCGQPDQTSFRKKDYQDYGNQTRSLVSDTSGFGLWVKDKIKPVCNIVNKAIAVVTAAFALVDRTKELVSSVREFFTGNANSKSNYSNKDNYIEEVKDSSVTTLLDLINSVGSVARTVWSVVKQSLSYIGRLFNWSW